MGRAAERSQPDTGRYQSQTGLAEFPKVMLLVITLAFLQALQPTCKSAPSWTPNPVRWLSIIIEPFFGRTTSLSSGE